MDEHGRVLITGVGSFLGANLAPALLERGYLRRANGDLAGARADWLTVIQVLPGTDLAAEAQKNIEKLEIR